MLTRILDARHAAFMLGLLTLAGCGALKLKVDSATSSTPPTPTCAATDSACFQKNLRLVEQGGSDIELVTIAGTLPAAATVGGNAPMVTDVILATGTTSMAIGSTTGITPLWLAFSDPLGSRPAFCMRTCPKNAMCITGGYRCTRSFKDGLISGVYKTWLGFKAEPVDSTTTADLQLQITPISTPDGSDPIAQFEAIESAGGDISQLGPDEVVVGEPVTVDQAVSKAADDDDADDDSNGDDDNDGGNDDDDDTDGNAEGTACTADSQCKGDCFTTRSCVKGISCSCAGVTTPGVCYNVTCEKAGGTCGDGKGCCVGLTCTNGQCVSGATSGCF